MSAEETEESLSAVVEIVRRCYDHPSVRNWACKAFLTAEPSAVMKQGKLVLKGLTEESRVANCVLALWNAAPTYDHTLNSETSLVPHEALRLTKVNLASWTMLMASGLLHLPYPSSVQVVSHLDALDLHVRLLHGDRLYCHRGANRRIVGRCSRPPRCP